MRYAAVLVLLLLAACPAPPREEPPPAADGVAPSVPGSMVTAEDGQLAGPAPYPGVALDYLVASLAEPTAEGYPPLGASWHVLSQLSGLSNASRVEAGPLRQVVLDQVAAAQGEPPPTLVAAWLAVEPAAGEEFLAQHLAAGETTYFGSLTYAPESGRRLLSQLDLAGMDPAAGRLTLDLLRQWGPPDARDAPLLRGLAEHSEPAVQLRAIGYLVALGEASEEQRGRLAKALRKRDFEQLVPAVEGARISGDGGLADALVGHLAGAAQGEVDPEAERDAVALYAAYALAFLPGEQAALMRRKLLGAVDGDLRWQARLGQLLHGEPEYWQAAVEEQGVEHAGLWLALQPPEVWNAALLPTYSRAAAGGDAALRFSAALHLNRYRALASEGTVVELISGLVQDPDQDVREMAWYSAGELGLAQLGATALATVPDAAQGGRVRLAAAFCALCLAEAGVNLAAPAAPESGGE